MMGWHEACVPVLDIEIILCQGDCVMAMGNRAIWALLWVLGIPLPILVIAYFLTGGGCHN